MAIFSLKSSCNHSARLNRDVSRIVAMIKIVPKTVCEIFQPKSSPIIPPALCRQKSQTSNVLNCSIGMEHGCGLWVGPYAQELKEFEKKWMRTNFVELASEEYIQTNVRMLRLSIAKMWIEDWLIDTSGGSGSPSHRICLVFTMYARLNCHTFNASIGIESQQAAASQHHRNSKWFCVNNERNELLCLLDSYIYQFLFYLWKSYVGGARYAFARGLTFRIFFFSPHSSTTSPWAHAIALFAFFALLPLPLYSAIR